jgi:hypothetical protein
VVGIGVFVVVAWNGAGWVTVASVAGEQLV